MRKHQGRNRNDPMAMRDAGRREAEERAWHERRQAGHLGHYGSYGESEDQWAHGLNDGDLRADPRHAVLRHSVPHRRGSGQSGFDPAPYRTERVYGYGGYEPGSDAVEPGLDPRGPQPASNPYEQGRHDLRLGDLREQFAGRDHTLDVPPGGAWHDGPRTMPKGYERSDERIREDVCERLGHTRGLDVGEVSVAVDQGVVRLDGSVPTRRMKHAIEDIAADCVGVHDIENRIRVRPEGAPPVTEEDHEGLASTTDEYRVLNGRKA